MFIDRALIPRDAARVKPPDSLSARSEHQQIAESARVLLVQRGGTAAGPPSVGQSLRGHRGRVRIPSARPSRVHSEHQVHSAVHVDRRQLEDDRVGPFARGHHLFKVHVHVDLVAVSKLIVRVGTMDNMDVAAPAAAAKATAHSVAHCELLLMRCLHLHQMRGRNLPDNGRRLRPRGEGEAVPDASAAEADAIDKHHGEDEQEPIIDVVRVQVQNVEFLRVHAVLQRVVARQVSAVLLCAEWMEIVVFQKVGVVRRVRNGPGGVLFEQNPHTIKLSSFW